MKSGTEAAHGAAAVTPEREIKILHLEDVPSDAELVERQLRESGLRFVLRRAATHADFLETFQAFHPDVVLVDYSLPDFSGRDAIRVVRSSEPDLPVIIVTGFLGDEAAVSVIKAGATDYILKDRLARLPSAVEHAIGQAEQSRARKRAEAELYALNADLEKRVALRTAELERLRAYDAEVGLRIQQSLLLSGPPAISGFQIAALSVPSQRIDGDFYIFFPHPDHTLDLVVGDVMGKGIPAALLAAAIKSKFLKALAYMTAISDRKSLPNPADVVMLAHSQVVHELIKLESFVSLCYVRLDLSRKNASIVDCGHTGVLHWRAAMGRADIIHGDGLPLGIREGEIFGLITERVASNDILLVFSDGITEARNAAGDFYGVERLLTHVEANSALEPEALVASIQQDVAAFTGSTHLTDDLTSVAIRIAENPVLAHQAIDVRSHPRELRKIRAFARRFCAEKLKIRPVEEFVDSLELAVNEAASNVMRHAYQGKSDQWIRVEAEALQESVSVRLRHLGRLYAPTDEPRVPDCTSDTGYGRYIMEHSVDRVLYYRDDLGRSCASLVKFRGNRKEVDSDGTGDR